MRPELGQIVLWYPDADPNAPPHPAMVTAVGQEACCLNVFGPDTMNMRIREGARHVSDPLARRAETRSEGSWDFTPRDRRLMRLEADLAKAMGEEGGA